MNNDPIHSSKEESIAEIVSIALNAIPVVGGVLSGVANRFIENRQNVRLNEFLVSLAEDIKGVESCLNKAFIESAGFVDLVEELILKASETRQKEKLDALRSIFVNTVISAQPRYNEVVEIIDLLLSWQPRHIIVIKILSDPLSADQKMGNVVGPGGGFTTSIGQILRALLPEWDDDQIERTWNDLYDANIHRIRGIHTMMTDEGIHQLENRLTVFGEKVARYLQ